MDEVSSLSWMLAFGLVMALCAIAILIPFMIGAAGW
jgi:hypothetical protein